MSLVGQSETPNRVRDGGSFPRKRSPGASDGCAADHCQPGLLLVAELAPIADAAGGGCGICNGPVAAITPPVGGTKVEITFVPSAGHVMNLPRRRFLHLAVGAAVLPAASRIARAQAYPAKPVRLVVAAAAGGPTDIVARLVGQWLSERLGQPFLIENRAGGSNNIGTEAVVRSAADGYTLLLANSVNAINASLYENLSYDFIRDIAPVAGIMRVPLFMEVNPSVPAKTVPEFIAYARANPGKVNMSSGGIGTPGHVSGELFKMLTGVNMIHVPYRGAGPALADLLSGQLQMMFDSMPSSIEYVRAGKIRPLAVTSAARLAVLPDLPTIGEFVPGFEASGWYGVGAPRNIPIEIVDRLNKEINAILADTKQQARLADLGGIALPGSPSDFGKLITDETDKWAKVVKFAGIKTN
jgi:tripartite-type tricarboxylate transporter receptor subunit TctC